jgi:hypothetical protein
MRAMSPPPVVAYDAKRGRQANMKILSSYDLNQQVTSDGATWLDRQLVSPNRIAQARVGFGEEVTKALEARTDELVRQGHASRTPDGVVRARADLLATCSATNWSEPAQNLRRSTTSRSTWPRLASRFKASSPVL